MKNLFEMNDKSVIDNLLDEIHYGVLAISSKNRPYSLPLNFVKIGTCIYFHGSKKGRKTEILKENSFASLSIVKTYSLIASYMSSNDGLACPATQFFQSVIIDGEIEFVAKYEEKTEALEALMQKLQSDGGYKALNEAVYTKMIDATTVYKLVPNEIRAKFKFGQHLTQERFEMILQHLKARNNEVDRQTLMVMEELRDGI